MDDLVSKLPIILLLYATYVLSPVTLFTWERFAESEERNCIVESLKVKNPAITLNSFDLFSYYFSVGRARQ